MSVAENVVRRERELLAEGIPYPEVHRVILAEFGEPEISIYDGPLGLTGGLDVVDHIYPNLIPDTGYPPSKPYEPYLSEPPAFHPTHVSIPQMDQQNKNYVATGADLDSQPEMHGLEGWSATATVNPDLEQTNGPKQNDIIWDTMIQEGIAEQDTFLDVDHTRKDYLHPTGEMPHMVTSDEDSEPELHIHLDIPNQKGSFSFDEPRSEWENVIQEAQFKAFTHSSSFVGNVLYDYDSNHMQVILNGKTYDFCGVSSRIFDSFEGANSKGAFFNRSIKGQFNCGSLPVREAIAEIRDEFAWLSNDYLDRVKKINSSGRFYLIRASAESITDHRGEGEPHRRKLAGDELHAMARTAINHGMDINHLGPDYKTDSMIMDSEYDQERKEIQMLVHEADPEIIRGIDRGDIEAVSINGGAPRSSSVECETDECFVVPRGVVLGEIDDIALTWVVTNDGGFRWRGRHISRAEPGVKITVIQPL